MAAALSGPRFFFANHHQEEVSVPALAVRAAAGMKKKKTLTITDHVVTHFITDSGDDHFTFGCTWPDGSPRVSGTD